MLVTYIHLHFVYQENCRVLKFHAAMAAIKEELQCEMKCKDPHAVAVLHKNVVVRPFVLKDLEKICCIYFEIVN